MLIVGLKGAEALIQVKEAPNSRGQKTTDGFAHI